MKAHLDISHSGTLDNERTRMTINPEDFVHIMRVVTDMYENPALAVIREIATNAYDSHRAAGNPAPIEVSMPTDLSPLYVVTDHGVGMSVDDIFNNFGKYGRSTKRETNNEVGMLGLGCKAPLTYTSQFTLVSVKDGIETTVLVTREEDGAGALQIIDTVSTDRPNGVEVQIPVKAVYSFVQLAFDFFRFWEPGTVLIDGKEPTYMGSDPLDFILEPDTVIVSRRISRDYVVMGNVAYPLPWDDEPLVESRKDNNIHAMIRVPIGVVDPTPSREALYMNKRSAEVLHDARQFISHVIHDRAQADVEAAPNHLEALQRADKWSKTYKGAFHYRGDLVPGHINLVGALTYRWNTQGREASRVKHNYVNLSDAIKAVHIHGFTLQSFPGTVKDKILKYLEIHGIEEHLVFCHPERVGSPWLDDLHWVSYDQIKAIVLPPSGDGGYTVSGTRIYTKRSNVKTVSDAELAAYAGLVWVTAKEVKGDYLPMHILPDNWAAVILRANQISKFKRNNPDIQSMIEWAEKYVIEQKTTFTSAQMFTVAGRSKINFRKFNPARVMDPELQSLVRMFNEVPQNTGHKWSALVNVARNMGLDSLVAYKVDHGLQMQYNEVTNRYPLLFDATQWGVDPDHLYEYVNAMYLLRSGLHLSRAY